jgi:hypothetical protein
MENILPRGRRMRLFNGLVLAGIALAATVFFIHRGSGAAWFSIVFVLVLLSAISLLQARDRT